MDYDAKNWLDNVRTLAAENGSVRVCLSSKPVEEGGRAARVRVLGLSGDGVTIIEEPRVHDMGTRLRPGDELDVLAVQRQTRLVGRCQVNGYIRHSLSETVRVDALQLSPPVKVFSGQLRDFYRAPVSAGVEVESVLLKIDPVDEATVQRARLAGMDPGKKHNARLVNISGGGVGLAILVDKALNPVFAVGSICALHAELPTLKKPLEIKARIVHAEKLNNGDLYLGMAFIFDDPAVQEHIEDQLQRLSVWLQRRMLRKEHGG